ncbi:MAG TPA: hypothetical protein VF808_14695 [Ktedonobacterales bacterium]
MRLLATAHDRNHYDITRDGQPVAALTLRVGALGRIELASGAILLLQREAPLAGRYTIAAEGAGATRTLLRATRPSPLRRAYGITIGDHLYTLRAETPWRGDYLLIEGADAATGAIRQAARGRDATADLPDALPPDAAIALFCFVLALWRQGNARVDTI